MSADIVPTPSSFSAACALCREVGGLPVFETARWRAIRVEDVSFPAFYRVVWRAHVAEWSDLPPAAQAELMGAVTAVERVLREALAPTKINLASLGNVVAHLHWHVVARFDWDTHFPAPIWAPAQREVLPPAVERLRLELDALDDRVREALSLFTSTTP